MTEALKTTTAVKERESLLTLQTDLGELIQLTQESLEAITSKQDKQSTTNVKPVTNNELNDEYALFMVMRIYETVTVFSNFILLL